TQPPGFVDPKFPNKVYKVMKDLYGLHQDPRACVKTASTPIETQKPLVKNEKATDVDVHLYRYLKGQLKLGLWHPKVSSFNLEAYSDSEYAGANLDKKSTIGDAYEKKLIQVRKIHTDDNVADLLMKAFDVSSNEALAILEQTTAGVNTPRCDEDSLELKELMVLFVPIYVEKDRVGVNAGDFQLRLLSKDLLLPVKQKEDGIFISQDKYVAEILKKFDFRSVKTASTPIETQKPLVKDEEAANVDVHLYRFQVTPKTSHLHVVKRIFRRLSIYWQETYLMAMQKADYYGYFYYKGIIYCCCTLLWISFVDSE
nr:hypothetical protein [Tanacetum cinerariifolium]